MRKRTMIGLIAALLVVGAILYVVFSPSADPSGRQLMQAAVERRTAVISEVMVSNPNIIPDEQGAFPDWVELYNPSEEYEVDLSSWGLSNERGQAKWAFPNGTTLAPGEYLIVYCDGSEAPPVEGNPLHASFKIKAGARPIVLTDAAGRLVEEVLSPKLADGKSWSRVPGGDEFVSMAPSPGFENSRAGNEAYRASMINNDSPIRLNEVQPANRLSFPGEDELYPDWIELYNPSNREVNIGGYGLSDNRARPLKWVFPAGTMIEPGEYLLVYCDGKYEEGQSSALHASFSLNGYEESVMLSDPRGRRIDAIDYSEVATDASYGRDEAGEWKIFTTPTPGYPNTDTGYDQYREEQNLLLTDSDLYIAEVMMANREVVPDPDGDCYDWIEIHNGGDRALDLSGYGLTNDSKNPGKWRFPDKTKIKPGQRLVLYAAGARVAKEKAEGEETKRALYINYRLNSLAGEVLSLWNAKDELIDFFPCPAQRDWTSSGRAGRDAPFRIYLTPQPGEEKEGGYRGYAPDPAIDTPAGLYYGAQELSAHAVDDGLALRYSTDGSVPNDASEEWKEPLRIERTTALRVRAFADDPLVLPSRAVTATYIIDSAHDSRLSIVSLVSDPPNLFDETTGIYMPGPKADPADDYLHANFRQGWERPAHVEIFSTASSQNSDVRLENASEETNSGTTTHVGNVEISQDISLRIFGDYSRLRDQKGFSLINRSAYGQTAFAAKVFENRSYEEYQSLILRAGGQDATVTKLHDVVATGLVDGTTNLQVQAYRQAVLYVNGEYFGYYHIREKVNKYWVEQHYGIAPDKLDLLVGSGTALVGENAGYKELLEYCETHDLSDDANYAYVSGQVDIENYIDYLVAQMYVANTDTGNIKFFRERSRDPERSKWRWIYYDFCWSFIDVDMDSFAYLTDPQGHGIGKAFSTRLNRSLFQNQDFRNQFLRRFAELLKTVYTPENVLAKIDECESVLIEEKPRDGERWPADGDASFAAWVKNIQIMKAFAKERGDYCIGYLRRHFSLNDEQAMRIFGSLGKKSLAWDEDEPAQPKQQTNADDEREEREEELDSQEEE